MEAYLKSQRLESFLQFLLVSSSYAKIEMSRKLSLKQFVMVCIDVYQYLYFTVH